MHYQHAMNNNNNNLGHQFWELWCPTGNQVKALIVDSSRPSLNAPLLQGKHLKMLSNLSYIISLLCIQNYLFRVKDNIIYFYRLLSSAPKKVSFSNENARK